MFLGISHSGEPCAPTGPGCGDEAVILWGTDLCVIKPHFSVTPFSKYPKDELRSWCACATHNANVDTWTVFLHQPVYVMDQIQQGTQGKCTPAIFMLSY